MYLPMAHRALAETRAPNIMKRRRLRCQHVGCHTVALQTELVDFVAPQHPRVHRSVRFVTGLAAVHPNRDMLENERAPFVRMTGHAGLCRTGRPLHVGPQILLVRRVTIAAFHGLFQDRMVERFQEIRPRRLVAPDTQTHFLGLQQTEPNTCRMDLVTRDAGQPVSPMRSLEEV